MTEQQIPRSKLSFSQAEGIKPLPQPLALGKLPKRVRIRLWDHIHSSLQESSEFVFILPETDLKDPWSKILYDHHIDFLYRPEDSFSNSLESNAADIQKLIMRQKYNRVFDFLQFVLRHELSPPGLSDLIKKTLEKFMCAYTVIEDDPTIVPISSPEQGAAIQESLKVLAPGPFEGARAHFRKSAECLNSNDLAGSVRESIHAIESVAKRLDKNAKRSLKPALDALVKRGMVLHPSLKKGVEKLYGYTSNEDGIRHALLEDNSNVDMEDAVFMFGACASFSSYLINKARKSGLFK